MLEDNCNFALAELIRRIEEGDVIDGCVDNYDFDWGEPVGDPAVMLLRGCGNVRTDLYVCGEHCDGLDDVDPDPEPEPEPPCGCGCGCEETSDYDDTETMDDYDSDETDYYDDSDVMVYNNNDEYVIVQE